MRAATLASDRRGNTISEFAMVLPVMLTLIMGMGDLAYQVYVQAILDGEVQKAGRDSAIQGGAQQADTIDARVISMVGKIVKGAVKDCSTTPAAPSWCAKRLSYGSFSIIKPEDFTDDNKNGIRDPGECFTDVNGNKSWDADPGITGQGGADDVTYYTVSVTFPRLFPVATLFGASNKVTITSRTLLKNQPYASQSVVAPASYCK
jgi:hypothetical protein